MVFFLSLPVTPEVKGHLSRVLVLSVHCPLVFLRHESTGGGSGSGGVLGWLSG